MSADPGQLRDAMAQFVSALHGSYLDQARLLPVGERIAGPAIVLQMDSTTVVPPQHSFEADPAGNLIIRKEVSQ